VEMLTGGALLLCAIAGLIVVLRLRSRGGSGNRRTPAHTRAAAPGGDLPGRSSMPATSGARTGPGADGPDPRAGQRSSWAASAEDRDWPYADHPSWPAGSTGRPLPPDHPSWPAGGLGRPIGYGHPGGTATDFPYSDHPSWPAAGPGGPGAAS